MRSDALKENRRNEGKHPEFSWLNDTRSLLYIRTRIYACDDVCLWFVERSLVSCARHQILSSIGEWSLIGQVTFPLQFSRVILSTLCSSPKGLFLLTKIAPVAVRLFWRQRFDVVDSRSRFIKQNFSFSWTERIIARKSRDEFSCALRSGISS